MADPRFHNKSGKYTLKELSAEVGAKLELNGAHITEIEDVAALSEANEKHISFLDNRRYKEQFSQTKAGACIIHPNMQEFAPSNTALLLHDEPYKAYALIAQKFYPVQKTNAFIAKTAIIDETAEIGENVYIDEYAVIKAGVKIGEGCNIGAHSLISENVEIGAHCSIGSHVSLSHALLASHIRIYAGCRIGQDGFGFAISKDGFVKVPQLGRIIIEDGVEIGANTTIDRGAGPDTVIGAGTWIDNLVQIGHNVRIGKYCVIVAQVGISGSSELGDFVMLGGQSGVAGHLKIETGARIGAQSGVMRNLAGGAEYLGAPAVPIRQAMKQIAAIEKLASGKNKK